MTGERTGPQPPPPAPEHPHIGDDWAWRRAIRGNPTWHLCYRVLVFVAGLVLVLGGLALVPLPGPGWLIVILGIATWSTEFERAKRLLEFVKAKVRAWEHWVLEQPRSVKGLLAAATFAVVLGAVWLALRLTGLPDFLPVGLAAWMRTTVGL